MAIRKRKSLITTEGYRRARQSNKRGAFTLVELLIVLVILAAFAAMALPRLTSAFGRTQLQMAAQQLAEDLSSARLFAIENGVSYEVQRDTEGGQYIVQPFRMSFDGGAVANPLIEAKNPTKLQRDSRLAQSSDSGTENLPPREPDIIEMALEHGITFASPTFENDDDQSLSIDTDSVLGSRLAKGKSATPTETTPGVPSWQGIARFFSDGRANSSSIWLYSADGYQIELTVRRLTGGVRVGPIERQPKLDEEENGANDNGDASTGNL